MERTLTIIKPDSVVAGNAEKIFAHLEGEGFTVLAKRPIHLSEAQARAFYEVHKERPFYNDLVAFMTELERNQQRPAGAVVGEQRSERLQIAQVGRPVQLRRGPPKIGVNRRITG